MADRPVAAAQAAAAVAERLGGRGWAAVHMAWRPLLPRVALVSPGWAALWALPRTLWWQSYIYDKWGSTIIMAGARWFGTPRRMPE